MQAGDSLWAIAERLYGDGSRWQEITGANPQLQNPNAIYAGQVLNLPGAPVVPARADYSLVQQGERADAAANLDFTVGSAWAGGRLAMQDTETRPVEQQTSFAEGWDNLKEGVSDWLFEQKMKFQMSVFYIGIGLTSTLYVKGSIDSELGRDTVSAEVYEAAELVKVAKEIGRGFIDPKLVRFIQDSISENFSDGSPIDDLVRDLKSGEVTADQVNEIRLVDKDGNLYTLDNRRLEAFRQAEVDVPFRMATTEEIKAESWKFTTKNHGMSIRIRRKR